MTMNGKKWAVAGVLSLAAMFGFAASYTPKIEVTGPLASVGSYGDDIQQIGLSAPDGRVVNFNVAALHQAVDSVNLALRRGVDFVRRHLGVAPLRILRVTCRRLRHEGS